MSKQYIFSSESVAEGHPDKIADQISDTILDAMLQQDPDSRSACECLITKDLVIIAGEIKTKAKLNIERIVRETICSIGYDSPEKCFDGNTCKIEIHLHEQSPDIAQGVIVGEGKDKEQGAGDQGFMYGYAVNETKTYMPLAITLAHGLVQEASRQRKENILPYLRADGKAQVSIVYEDDRPIRVDTVVLSFQHAEEVSEEQVFDDLKNKVAMKVIPKELWHDDIRWLINPTGRFVIGGPTGDCGLTGRKIIVDTYGGASRHGGGAFSGKDASKVDRSAAYMARYIAKNIVASGAASACEVQLAYAIGFSEPVSIKVDFFGTGKVEETDTVAAIRKIFKLKPAGIVASLDLKRPIFAKTAAYGHFGRELPEFTWEKTDKVADLKQELHLS